MEGETILCASPRMWHSLWRETQYVMSGLAKKNRVLYVEPGRDADESRFAEMKRTFSSHLALKTYEPLENLIVIEGVGEVPNFREVLPRSILRLTYPCVLRINAQLAVQHLRRVIRVFGVKSPIFWLSMPNPHVLGRFETKLTCYHNYDEFPNFTKNARIKALLRQSDNEFSSKVDVVLATSQSQCRQRKMVNPHTYLLHNGVDFETFHRALDPDLPLPADISRIPGPIIGCAGWLGYQIDVELLNWMAKTHPDWSIVLVGPNELPDSLAKKKLQSLPNVYFLGKKSRTQLAAYLKAFDVALIPYLLEGYVLTAYPMKLHEYLAAGRAIVSTALPELEPYHNVVRIGRSPDQFINLVQEALLDRRPESIQTRVAVAQDNSWDRRVETIHQILDHHLQVKSAVTRTQNNCLPTLRSLLDEN